jgi:pimeloyl-ACP methyl ester carboxylesterase
VVKDIQDLRKTLGLKQVDLFGVSYGTRIALAVVKHDPTGVRAVVLDSPWTPEAKWAEGGPEMVSDAVKVIFKRCAEDAACNAKYPHPGADLDAVAAKLLAGPQTRWPDLHRRPAGRLPDGRGLQRPRRPRPARHRRPSSRPAT